MHVVVLHAGVCLCRGAAAAHQLQFIVTAWLPTIRDTTHGGVREDLHSLAVGSAF
jgi:hypothetical protein